MFILKRNGFIVYLLIVSVTASVLHMLFSVKGAHAFDAYYFFLLVISMCLCSVLFSGSKFLSFLLLTTTAGIICAVISSIVYYLLDKSNIYFSFEGGNATWIGIDGFIKTVLYFFVAFLLSIIVWGIKLQIIKYIGKSNNN